MTLVPSYSARSIATSTVAPVSSPTRATCGACDLMNAAMVSGSDASTPALAPTATACSSNSGEETTATPVRLALRRAPASAIPGSGSSRSCPALTHIAERHQPNAYLSYDCGADHAAVTRNVNSSPGKVKDLRGHHIDLSQVRTLKHLD